MTEAALRELNEVIVKEGRTPTSLTFLAVAHAVAGHTVEAEQLLTELTSLSRQEYVPKTFFAYIYTPLSRKDLAFEALDQAYREHDATLLGLKLHPFYDPLRSDPRFTELLRRVGLPQ